MKYSEESQGKDEDLRNLARLILKVLNSTSHFIHWDTESSFLTLLINVGTSERGMVKKGAVSALDLLPTIVSALKDYMYELTFIYCKWTLVRCCRFGRE